mgnify:CR=1 FL=1
MNEMTKQIQQIMYPKAALIAYECETADFSPTELSRTPAHQ